MKFTIATTLLAATSALAAPATVKRDGEITITNWSANRSIDGTSTMSFVLTSTNYSDTPTDCNLIWPSGSNPDEGARCNNGEYSVKFPQGLQDFTSFSIKINRLTGVAAEEVHLGISDNYPSPWKCEQNPREGVLEHCDWVGPLTVSV